MTVTAEPTELPSRTPPPQRGRRGGVVAAVLVVLACAAGVAVIAYLALQTARGQDLDDRAMTVLSVNGDPAAARPVLGILSDLSIGSAAVVLVAFVALALLRRGFALAGGAAALVIGANLTTQALKHLVLSRPDLDGGTLDGLPNSLPSGHTTLIFSLVLAALLVAPVRLRLPAALVGTTVGTLTGAAIVVGGWHRPSDVVASMLVTLAWGAAVAALLAVLAPPSASPRRLGIHVYAVAGLLGSAAAAALLVAWGVGPGPGPGEMFAAVLSLGSVAVASPVVVGGYARLLHHTVD